MDTDYNYLKICLYNIRKGSAVGWVSLCVGG